MLKLEQITPNTALVGIELGQIVRVVATEPVGPDALTVVYKTADGRFGERMVFRNDEANLIQRAFRDLGGRFIVPLPQVKILS